MINEPTNTDSSLHCSVKCHNTLFFNPKTRIVLKTSVRTPAYSVAKKFHFFHFVRMGLKILIFTWTEQSSTHPGPSHTGPVQHIRTRRMRFVRNLSKLTLSPISLQKSMMQWHWMLPFPDACVYTQRLLTCTEFLILEINKVGSSSKAKESPGMFI